MTAPEDLYSDRWMSIHVTVKDGQPVLTCDQHPNWNPQIRGDRPAWLWAKIQMHLKAAHEK